MTIMTGKLLYFADPMCSWCWGFAPVIQRLADEYGDRLPIEVIAGGLRNGERRPLTPSLRDRIHGHWQRVEEMTGQPFHFDGSLPDGFTYDTEPANRALLVIRQYRPDATLGFLHRLQRAFYQQSRDITCDNELAALAVAAGMDAADFSHHFASDEAHHAVADEADRRFEAAVTGFPTLIWQIDGRMTRICQGYQPFEDCVLRLQEVGAID